MNKHIGEGSGDRVMCEKCGHVVSGDNATWGKFHSYEAEGPYCIACARKPGFLSNANFAPGGPAIGRPIGGKRRS